MLDPQRDENGKPKTSDGHFTPVNLPNKNQKTGKSTMLK